MIGQGNRTEMAPHRQQQGTWIGAGLTASGRGLVLSGLVLAEAAMLSALAIAVSFAPLGAGLLLIPGMVLASRGLLNRIRRLGGEWCGVHIPVPYLPGPGGGPGFRRRLAWLGADPATWRDLLWMGTDSVLGWVLPLAPAALLLYGLFGVVMPAVWGPIARAGGTEWYAFIPESSTVLAWLSVPLGVAFAALALWLGPRLLRWYFSLASTMLGPSRQAALAQRVSHLARTRSDTLGASAAEIRRIERDLHDGAQARLVAMGMTLDAAERMLDGNPAAARELLAEARSSSAQALAELRDLVRGIHPPVLADRGLVDALRALALDSPLPARVTSTVPGRPEPPVESAVYFAVSELLANVSKHAGARQAWVDLRYSGGALRVDVGDDGAGGARPSRGSGLPGIERRLAAFDGILAISSPPGGPTIVTMEIPCALSSPKTSSF